MFFELFLIISSAALSELKQKSFFSGESEELLFFYDRLYNESFLDPEAFQGET